MPIAKEILDVFEFIQNKKNTFSVYTHFNEWPLSQQRSVPAEELTLTLHRYLLIESHGKASVALWVHPFTHNTKSAGLFRCDGSSFADGINLHHATLVEAPHSHQ